MESQLRALLYAKLEDRQVAFNPVEPEPFDLVDLTQDVTNSTRIYHLRTECVREALEGASLIVTDSQALGDAVSRVLPRLPVISLPFATVSVASPGLGLPSIPCEAPLVPTPKAGRAGTPGRGAVGLLNHNPEMEMNNLYALKMLKSFRMPLLIYGRPLAGLEAEVEENFSYFSERCDILLLPSLPGVINSTTLPLALMGSHTAILAHNAPGYYDLSAATGVQLLPPDPDTWARRLAALASRPAIVRTMQERNRAYATRLNRESYNRLAALVKEFTHSPTSLSEGCGCAKRKAAPTQPQPEYNRRPDPDQ